MLRALEAKTALLRASGKTSICSRQCTVRLKYEIVDLHPGG